MNGQVERILARKELLKRQAARIYEAKRRIGNLSDAELHDLVAAPDVEPLDDRLTPEERDEASSLDKDNGRTCR